VSAFTSANAALKAVTTDGLFACPARRTARAQAAAGADVYLYAFEHPPEEPIEPGLGVFHIAEVSFVFGVDDGLVTLQPDERPELAAVRVSDRRGGGLPRPGRELR
jgi:para-nitrobenzyl esterase